MTLFGLSIEPITSQRRATFTYVPNINIVIFFLSFTVLKRLNNILSGCLVFRINDTFKFIQRVKDQSQFFKTEQKSIKYEILSMP